MFYWVNVMRQSSLDPAGWIQSSAISIALGSIESMLGSNKRKIFAFFVKLPLKILWWPNIFQTQHPPRCGQKVNKKNLKEMIFLLHGINKLRYHSTENDLESQVHIPECRRIFLIDSACCVVLHVWFWNVSVPIISAIRCANSCTG